MLNYYRLPYFLDINRLINQIDRIIPGIQCKIEEKKIKNNPVLFLIYYIFDFLFISAKHLLLYAFIVPFLVFFIDEFWGLNHSFFSYYYVLIIFMHFAIRTSKCKIVAADYVEYYYLKIFKISKDHFLKIKKNDCLIDTFIRLLNVYWSMIYLSFDLQNILLMFVGMIFVDILGNDIALLLVNNLKMNYIKKKMIIVLTMCSIIPSISVLVWHNSTAFTIIYPLCFLQLIGIVLLYIIFFRSRNSTLYCELMIQQYYYNNMLLASIDQTQIDEKVQVVNYNFTDACKYFSQIFFERHKKPVHRSLRYRGIIAFAAAGGGTFFLSVLGDRGKFVIILLLPALLYELSMSNRLCFLYYTNCDKNMLCHNWYKEVNIQNKLIKERIRWALKYNLCLSVVLSCGYFFVSVLCGNRIKMILIVSIFLIMALHSIYDNLVYHSLKPYTSDLKIRTPLYYLYKSIYIAILTGCLGIIV